MMKLCAALAVALSVLGQESENRYDALKQALGLSDAQLSQLQEIGSAPTARPAPIGPDPIAIYPLDFARMMHPAPNGDSLRVLDDSQRAKLAVIQKVWDRWDAVAFAIQLGLIDEKLWPGGSATLCFYPIRAFAYATELGLSESQALQLDQLKEAARATHSRPPRDLAMAVLDETQRGRVAAFEQVANEAIELRLIPVPLHGEPLCH